MKIYLSLLASRLRDALRAVRGKSVKRADIGVSENFGKMLRALACCESFREYVEIGTAHGLGSTKIIADALMSRQDDSRLWTVESKRYLHRRAMRNWRGANAAKLRFLCGAVGRDFLSWEEIAASEFAARHTFAEWQKRRRDHETAPVIVGELPAAIDVLILDGGEFSSYGDFCALQSRVRGVICMDDSHHALKNFCARKELLQSAQWRTAADVGDERNGWSVFCRPEVLEIVMSISPAAK